MEKSGYSKGIRVAVAILEVFFITLCTVSIGIVSCNAVISVPNRKNTLNYNYYVSPFSKTAAFEDSEVFNDMLYDNLSEIIRYSVIRSQLETKGSFNENKQIDIEQYARHFEEMPVTETSVKYRLGDLLQWGQLRDGISMNEYSYAEAVKLIQEAHGIYMTDMQAAMLAESQLDGQRQEADGSFAEAGEEYVLVPVERYRPVNGRSLLSYADSVEELKKLTAYLQETVEMLEDNYTSYKEYQAYYDKEKLNLQYCVLWESEGKTEIYSSTDFTGKGAEEINDHFCKMGRYLCFRPADFAYDSNTAVREEQVRNIWNNYSYAYPDNMSVWVGVDTSYPCQDMFYYARESYSMAAPGYLFILLCIISAILAVVMLGVMTKMAGRRKGAEGVSLLRFDKWYTEISAVFGILAGIACLLIDGAGVGMLYEASQKGEMLAILALGTAVTDGVFLFFYLSLVRRIKAGVFWKGFLIYQIYLRFHKILIDIYNDSRNVVRIWVPYLLFLGCNLFLLSFKMGVLLALVSDFLVGVFLYRSNRVRKKILEGIENIRGGNLDYQIDTSKMYGDNKILAEAVNSIGNGIREAVETSMKDERMKADLITNVSHDIKTPLTSIINYVALIKREPVQNEKIEKYLEVLENKSQRLKQLTEDLVEASKISSGNIELQCDKLDLVELMNQTIGEFTERFEEKNLKLIVSMEEKPLLIWADSRRIWRVVENLFQNVGKYALENTRVYVEAKKIAEEGKEMVRLSVKNISAQPLCVGVEDLTERFIRGDVSRSTEGSGLGLSIAKNLTELQKGSFEIVSDGDLFKVVITFPLVV